MTEKLRAPDVCANCGAAIPPKALACPSCGADERTGWREASVYDGVDLPDTEPPANAREQARNPAIGRMLFVLFMIVLAAIFLLG